MRTNSIFGVRGVILGALVMAALGGCSIAPYDEGGSGVSIDQHVFVSTADIPKTVTLVDTRTKEVLWTVEVPVGQKLAIRFSDGYYRENDSFPDQMRWDLMPAGQAYGGLSNEMAVPHARLIDWSIRTPGEFPPAAAKQPVKAAEVIIRD